MHRLKPVPLFSSLQNLCGTAFRLCRSFAASSQAITVPYARHKNFRFYFARSRPLNSSLEGRKSEDLPLLPETERYREVQEPELRRGNAEPRGAPSRAGAASQAPGTGEVGTNTHGHLRSSSPGFFDGRSPGSPGARPPERARAGISPAPHRAGLPASGRSRVPHARLRIVLCPDAPPL